MTEKDRAAFQACCAEFVGGLDRLQGAETPIALRRPAANLSAQTSDFYATAFLAFEQQDDALADTLRAEDFDHFPPTTKKSQA